jgi:hypothetical protein
LSIASSGWAADRDGNMRANGVPSLDVSCWNCHQRAIAYLWPDHVPLPTFGPRMDYRQGRNDRHGRCRGLYDRELCTRLAVDARLLAALACRRGLGKACMRLPTASLFLIVAVLLGGMQAASTQSPTSYQWCPRHFGNWVIGPRSCYFTSYQQCRTTLCNSGVCFQSPYYYQPPPGAPRAAGTCVPAYSFGE